MSTPDQTSNPSGQTPNPSGQTSNPSGQTTDPLNSFEESLKKYIARGYWFIVLLLFLLTALLIITYNLHLSIGTNNIFSDNRYAVLFISIILVIIGILMINVYIKKLNKRYFYLLSLKSLDEADRKYFIKKLLQ